MGKAERGQKCMGEGEEEDSSSPVGLGMVKEASARSSLFLGLLDFVPAIVLVLVCLATGRLGFNTR